MSKVEVDSFGLPSSLPWKAQDLAEIRDRERKQSARESLLFSLGWSNWGSERVNSWYRQVDKKFGVPEEKGVWALKEEKRTNVISTLLWLSLHNNVSCWRTCFSLTRTF